MISIGRIVLLVIFLMLPVTTSYAATGAVTSYSPAAKAFGSSGGIGTVAVTATGTWTASTTDSWITITSQTSFTGDGSVSFGVSSNTSGFERTGAISLGDECFIITQTKSDFSDNLDASAWSQEPINAIYAAGITTGCGNNYFCATKFVTREEMATFIIRAILGEGFSFTQQPYFADIPSTAWSYRYVQKLKDLGLTSSIDAYNGSSFVTREQMAAFLIRAKFGEDFDYPTTPFFSDVPNTAWSFKYVQKLKALGYTNASGKYGAAENITRDQMAAFLSRVFLGMTSKYVADTADTAPYYAGKYDGMILDSNNGTIGTFTFTVNAAGTVTGRFIDAVDNNTSYAFLGNYNSGREMLMFRFVTADGSRITVTGTLSAGTWTKTASGKPATTGTSTSTKRVDNPEGEHQLRGSIIYKITEGFVIRDLQTGEVTAPVKPEFSYGYLNLSPDKKKVVLSEYIGGELYLYDIGGRKLSKLAAASAQASLDFSAPAFIDNDTVVAIGETLVGSVSLYTSPIITWQPAPVAGAAGSYKLKGHVKPIPGVSGGFVAANGDLHVIRAGNDTKIVTQAQVNNPLGSGGAIRTVSVSPDGKTIAFYAVNAKGADEIWTVGVDGSNLKKALTGGRYPAWSPDGKYVAFVATSSTVQTSELTAVPLKIWAMAIMSLADESVWLLTDTEHNAIYVNLLSGSFPNAAVIDWK